jgi:beta-lactamase regulating signal transducer with metallopeptidase domain
MARGKEAARMTLYAVSFFFGSLVMGAVILIFMSLGAFAKMFSAKLRYMVWAVILAGLLIPLSWIEPGGLIAVPFFTETGARQTASEIMPAGPPGLPIRPRNTPFLGAALAPSVSLIIVTIWGAVAIFVFAFQLWRYFKFIKFLRRWGAPVGDENVLKIFGRIKNEKGLSGKNIALLVCGSVPTSLLTGFIRPVIALPDKHFEDDELELIFNHELTHYKRGDLYAKLLGVAAISVHWFNPMVYLMYNMMQTDGEAYCDETVLKGQSPEDRQFYAELMVKMIGGAPARTLLSTCFYGGRRSVKKRIDAILDATAKMKMPAYVVFIAFALLTAFSGSVFAFNVQDNTAAAPRTESAGIIGEERAKEIALTAAGGGKIVMCNLENKPIEDILIYHIHVHVMDGANVEYCVEVDAVSGYIYKAESRPMP